MADLDDLTAPPGFSVMMMLADAAQVVDNKLYILGGGLSVIEAKPRTMALAMRISVPWDQANIRHSWRMSLLDDDGHVVKIGEKDIVFGGHFEAGRPAGLLPGTPLGVPIAVNLTGLAIPTGAHSFRLTIDDEGDVDWRVGFVVKEPRVPKTA